MRFFWFCIAVLAVGSIILLWNHRAPGTGPETIEPPPEALEPLLIVEAPIAQQSVTQTNDDAAELAAELLASAEAREEVEAAQAETLPSAAATGDLIDPGALVAPSLHQFPLENTVPVVVKQLDDGSVLLDDRFVLRGSGSEDDPFLITWDLLISASETYTPRLGKLKLPQRVTMLHEKYVKITGHVAFPQGVAEMKELLAMMNMWDGCCIGVPPSPYDALEVQLREPLRVTRQHFSPFATVQGRLKVDPYLIENWLVGLYLLEDATVNLEL